MKAPVLIKIVTGAQGTKTQDGLGTSETPAGAGNFHAVFNQMSARPFNNSRSDGIPLGKVMIVLEVRRMGKQIVSTGIYRFSLCAEQRSTCSATAHTPRHITGLAPQYFEESNPNPVLQFRA
ncbi:MAG: hypothetical protein JRJ70_15280, partial [Deltaproteobacteria bacterium]|nr:hypothetical protein [Deltaproteobacteria bacterium]